MTQTTDRDLPSLGLVRHLTDEHVLDQLVEHAELTRAQLAAQTGISKPTISECVRRLVAAGLLSESGQQVGKRGPAGTFYRLREGLGRSLAIGVGPDGVVVESTDLRGVSLRRVDRPVASPIDAARLNPVLLEAVQEALAGGRGPVRGCAVSVAGPVDQHTGRLIRLAYSPFLLDDFDPRRLLDGLVECEVQVDNDVNWAALAEHHGGAADGLDHVVYCYLGPGIGAAVLVDGQLVHGARGLAGELAHVPTIGPGGRAVRLIECFAAWDLLRPDSLAIDLPSLLTVLAGESAADRQRRGELADALAGAIASVTALLNPQRVLIGGPWGTAYDFDRLVAERVHDLAVIDTEVVAATLGSTAPLAGARVQAVRSAQTWLRSRGGPA